MALHNVNWLGSAKLKDSFTDKNGYLAHFSLRHLQTFCEIGWPSFKVRCPSKYSLNSQMVPYIWNRATWVCGQPRQFSYINQWLLLHKTNPPWLKICALLLRTQILLVHQGTEKHRIQPFLSVPLEKVIFPSLYAPAQHQLCLGRRRSSFGWACGEEVASSTSTPLPSTYTEWLWVWDFLFIFKTVAVLVSGELSQQQEATVYRFNSH